MLSSPSAVETLDRNSPSGSLASVFESVLEEDSFSTSARSVFALLVFPDLMSDIRLESALSKEFVLLEVLEVDDVEVFASSLKRDVLLLDKLEISMNRNPFCLDCSIASANKNQRSSGAGCPIHFRVFLWKWVGNDVAVFLPDQ